MGSLALHMNLNIFRENEDRPELNVIIVRKKLLSTPASKRDWLANCVDTRASFAGRFNAVLFFSKMHQTRRPWLKKKEKKEGTLPSCFLYLNSEGCVQQKQCTGRERDQYSIAHFHGIESGYTRQIQSILDFAHDKPLFLGKVMYHFDRPWNSWTRAQ